MSFYHHPEDRNKHRMMFHTSAFAISAGVVGVGSSGASGAISMSAAASANKAQGQAAKQFKKQQRKAVKGLQEGQRKTGKMIKDVQVPVYDYAAMQRDAEKETEYNRGQLEEFLPGAAAGRERQMQLINQAMGVLQEGLQGGYGQDLKENIMRDVAQFAGAGFNPATAGQGGFQASQGLAARQLGQTSRAVQMESLAALPQVSNVFATWNELAKGFTAKIGDVGRLQLGYQTAGSEVGLQKARMTGSMFTDMYNAQSGLASQIYGANKETAAASYANTMAGATAASDFGKAGVGALSGMSYASAAKQGLGGGMNNYASMGGYGSNQQAKQTAAAYNPYGNYGSTIIS